MIVHAVVNIWPFQVYGNWFAQTASVLVILSNGSTVNVSVRIVSHPGVKLFAVSMIVPAVVNIWPFQVYGNWFAQTANVLVIVSNGSTVNVSVRIVSHPGVRL